MVEIIKEGSEKRYKFACVCGCVFIAEESECKRTSICTNYEPAWGGGQSSYAQGVVIICPFCKTECEKLAEDHLGVA